MANDDNLDFSDGKIFGGPQSKLAPKPNTMNKKRVIKQGNLPEISKVMTIGGNCKDDNAQPPSIILERDGDRITRIIVKCSCGRHAELECEEEENENPEE